MKKFNILSLAAGVAMLGLMASCQKENGVAPAANTQTVAVSPVTSTPTNFVEPSTKGTIALVSGVYNVRNFHQGTVADLTDTTKWATRSSTYYYNIANSDGGTSSSYDFRFEGRATGDFVINTTKYNLYYADVAFGSVTASTSKTAVSSGVFGYNSLTPGWYNYNILTHEVSAVANRTIILTNKTGVAKYKIRINSIYYNATPVGSPAANYPYYSLDYQAL
ncbi:hypothetical protein D0C36_03550 [Mucilaginibacter conchicola]|uniref:Heme-binding HmuY-like protein n=1 Tax=Mucilaginibacter conchicola TaxID=2303333 RepID=A0A372NXN8_9SPHI|nr:hypothetical protein [Mucilaginibacter conchicola]RFZ94631.1 hypothetical protein D0C36_03550 [Mucilaginibacter conchicola]